jgi:hypothetical protein
MIKKVMVLLGLFLILVGCQDKGLTFHIIFDHVEGLKENDRVIFDQNHIGRVTGVRYDESGSFTVSVEIKRAFAKAVTEHARFFIVPDPQEKTEKAVEMIQLKKGGALLEDGCTVKGSSKDAAPLNGGTGDFEKGLKELERHFKEFSDQLQSIPESEAYKDLKKELERLAEDMKKAGGEAREKMEKEVLPRLREELEKLRERFFEPQEKKEEEKPLSV